MLLLFSVFFHILLDIECGKQNNYLQNLKEKNIIYGKCYYPNFDKDIEKQLESLEKTRDFHKLILPIGLVPTFFVDCRPQGLFTYYVIISLKSQTESCGRRPPQLVVTRGHNIFEVTVIPICGQRSLQFLVPEGHRIH